MKTEPASKFVQKKRVLVITLGAPTGTSAYLFAELSRVLSQDHDCRNVSISLSGATLLGRGLSMLKTNFYNLANVIWAQVVIVHVFSVSSIFLLAMARLIGRKIIIFQWDIYPTTIAGRPFMTSMARRFAHLIEAKTLRLATVIVLPSEDFRSMSSARNPVIFPLWPQSELPQDPVRVVPAPDDVTHIAFAGQINELRGLRECIAHLRERSQGKIVLHIFSSDTFADELQQNDVLRLEHHGYVSRSELHDWLARMHFGLISLNPRLDQPGFPSKTFDYLAAGLPILYFGRPLPAFTGLLEGFGVGKDLTALERIEPQLLYHALIANLESGRQAWHRHTRLESARLAPLL